MPSRGQAWMIFCYPPHSHQHGENISGCVPGNSFHGSLAHPCGRKACTLPLCGCAKQGRAKGRARAWPEQCPPGRSTSLSSQHLLFFCHKARASRVIVVPRTTAPGLNPRARQAGATTGGGSVVSLAAVRFLSMVQPTVDFFDFLQKLFAEQHVLFF